MNHPDGLYVSPCPNRRRHVASHRSSSFTLLQSLTIEDSRDKPTYSVLLGQLFAFIGTNPDQAVSRASRAFPLMALALQNAPSLALSPLARFGSCTADVPAGGPQR